MTKTTLVIFGVLLIYIQSMAYPTLAPSATSQEFVVSEGTALYKTLMPLALLWKNTIIRRDFQAINNKLLPENTAATVKALKNPKSDLYRYLYDDAFVKQRIANGKSVYTHLKNTQGLQVVLIGREPIAVFGVTAIFYDAKNSKPQFPMSDQFRMKYWMVKYAECGFLEVDGEWKVVFEMQFGDN